MLKRHLSLESSNDIKCTCGQRETSTGNTHTDDHNDTSHTIGQEAEYKSGVEVELVIDLERSVNISQQSDTALMEPISPGQGMIGNESSMQVDVTVKAEEINDNRYNVQLASKQKQNTRLGATSFNHILTQEGYISMLAYLCSVME